VDERVDGRARELVALARRIERAHAMQLERTRAARGSGAPALVVGGGLAVSHGVRSPFSAAIGMGIGEAVTSREVDRIEAHLGLGGGPVRIEVTPFADASLTEELGRRGYQLERFFQVWTREPEAGKQGSLVRIAEPADAAEWVEIFSRSFWGAPTQSDAQREALRAMLVADGSVPWLAEVAGASVAVALSSAEGGVAWLSGAGVLPASRGQGIQEKLVRARLAWAYSRGSDVAASATEPGTASQRTLERCGFRAAYPKAVLVH
jgi:GNAT superfamily N-acetyltransferase